MNTSGTISPALLSCRSQIVFAYEELGLAPEVIAEQFDDYSFTREEILNLLSVHSPKYIRHLAEREKLSGTHPDPLRGEDELNDLMAEYRILSKISENDLVRERALKFLINEKKGRNDLAERGIKLKEKQNGLQEVNTAIRAQEFIKQMQEINKRLADAFPKPTQTLELTTTL
jgi:hypothetical protein